MLQIVIPERELWNEEKQEFVYTSSQTLQLEHSLVSLSKWECKWHKPFLSGNSDDKSYEETLDYIRCMTLTQNVRPDIYFALTKENMDDIQKYIEEPMTAAKFSDAVNSKYNTEYVSAETIYYWMISFNIPMECQKWHLNRLLALIRFCDIKNDPKKRRKMSKRETMDHYAKLNEERRRRLHSKG